MNSGYVARIISSQKIYGLYGLKHHIVEMRGGVTDAGQTNNRMNNEDRATQPMEAGGWVSQFKWTIPSILFFNICTRAQICIFAFLYIYYISCRLWKVCLQYLLQGLGVDAAFDQELKSLTILPAGLTCQDFLNFQTSATSQRKPTPLYLSIQFNRNTYICRKHFKKKYILFDCETYICSGGNDRDGRWLLFEPVFVASVKLIWNSLGLPSLVVKQQFIGRGFLVKDDLREQHNQIRQFAREDLKQPYQIAVCALNGSGNGREVW